MASVICFGAININSPQQNAGVFVGEVNCGGWDANEKVNQGHGALFGFFNVILNQQTYVTDSFEMIDGMINDQDFKPIASMNI
ncbi:hypothetical protein [Alicyclobacillus fastidiosus]|uniref:Uncharacterized protein n=1 Tax=Alicyclobacillus fastidiosus TaxID=392011 RepID=A0ABV5A9B2_9BACL|nr:hypothetical protein [Alicyclobacillus fastidiosus]WEH10793.1 hypothetical protein PYS47_06115 [Alicyclobacillus fastidiosus]